MPKPCASCPFAGCPGCEFQSICSVEGCEKPRAGRYRLCAMHRARLDRHGDVNYVTPRVKDPAPRFWAKVDKTETCWLWTGHLINGYGSFSVLNQRWSAHRYSWLLAGRPEVPEGMQLDHLCRVRNCVRPDHLEVVTPQENTLRSDAISALNARKPVCPKCGGEYAVAKRGHRKPGRWCPPCHSERRRQRKAEQRSAYQPEETR